MRLWILTHTPASRSTTYLEEAATDSGHDVDRVDFEKVTVRHAHPGPTLAGVPSSRPDLVLNRLHGDETHLRHGTRVQAALESMGILGINTAAAMQVAVVKSATSQRLSAAGLPQPPTVIATVDTDPDTLVDFCGLPMVLKPDRGIGASGVLRVDTAGEVAPTLTGLAERGVRELVAQPFLPDATTTIRAVVVDGKVVAAVVGDAPSDEWRASLDVAVGVRAVQLPDYERALASAAARSCGLYIAGVDMVRVGSDTTGGPGSTLVIDVNPSPELWRTMEASGVDVYGAVLDFLEHVSQMGRLPGLRSGLAAID